MCRHEIVLLGAWLLSGNRIRSSYFRYETIISSGLSLTCSSTNTTTTTTSNTSFSIRRFQISWYLLFLFWFSFSLLWCLRRLLFKSWFEISSQLLAFIQLSARDLINFNNLNIIPLPGQHQLIPSAILECRIFFKILNSIRISQSVQSGFTA